MANEVQVFDNLKVKEVNGQVMFDAESAAIGMGIVETKKNGVTYIIWNRVNKYLGLSTDVSKIGKGDFIKEPQFYKLAIKANNETAERFQDWVTSEVLPSIRKTGSYGVRELTQEEIVGKAFLIDDLINNHYLYRIGSRGRLQPYSQYVGKWFVLKSVVINGSALDVTPQTLITPKGREPFYKLFYAPDQTELCV